MTEKAVKHSAKLSCAEATEALQELAQMEISTSSVWRLTQEWGEALKMVEAKEEKEANEVIESTATGKKPEAIGRLGASLDGTMISVREEGWKELKVGCFFDVELARPLDPHTLDKDDLAHATKHLSSAAHLAFGEGFAEAQRWFEQQELPFFGAIMGGRFDERWRTAYNSPQN